MRQAPMEEPIRARSRGAPGSHSPNSHWSSAWKISPLGPPAAAGMTATSRAARPLARAVASAGA
ncbi:hypothetical protein LP419_16160 [Massilia sp. H-1]|nr:hypothetical protein LP419_16160 [Massilia sp. H-1]